MNAVTFRQRAASVLTDNSGARRRHGARSGRWLGRNLAMIAAGSDRIFACAEKRRFAEYVIVLLLDLSGSMSRNRCNRMAAAAKSVQAIHKELTAIGARVLVRGFNRKLELIDLQEPTEKLKEPQYIAYCERACWGGGEAGTEDENGRGYCAGTHDHAAIRRARELIEKQPEAGKIVFTFGDGMPRCDYESDCNADCMADSKQPDALRNEIAKTRKAGIQVLALGIQTDAPLEFYGKKQAVEVVKPDAIYSAAAVLLTKNLIRG